MEQSGKCKISPRQVGCECAELCQMLLHWCHPGTRKFSFNRKLKIAKSYIESFDRSDKCTPVRG